MRKFYLLLPLLYAFAFAQTGTIAGVVYDKETSETLPGVNVLLDHHPLGTATDVDGIFSINVPIGKYTLRTEYVGYKTATIKDVQIADDDTVHLDVFLSVGEFKGHSMHQPQLPYDSQWPSLRISSDIPMPVATRSTTFADADIIELERGSLSEGPIITSRGEYAEDQLYLISGVTLNDPRTSRLKFRIPSIYPSNRRVHLHEQPLENRTVGGNVFSSDFSHSGGNKIMLQAVSSEPTDDFGYNDISGVLNFQPSNRSPSLFIGGSWLKLADDAPSAGGLDIPNANISSNSLPGTGSRLATWLVGSRFEVGDLHSEVWHIGMDRRARRFIPGYAKNNSEHHPLTENSDYITAFKSAYYERDWKVGMQLAYRQARSATGDGVWFDDLEAYGDVNRNAEIGVTLPGPGQRVGFDSLGVYFQNGRVSNSFQKSRSNTLSGKLNFDAFPTRSDRLQAGIDFERHQLSYYEIEPVQLGIYAPGERDLGYARQVGRFYGYDLFGEEISSSRVLNIPVGVLTDILLEETSPRTPVNIGSYANYTKYLGNTEVIAGLRFDSFDPAHRRIKNRDHFFEAGATNFRLEEEDFEDAPTEQYFSPQVTLRYRTVNNFFQLNMQLAHQRPPLMFYYDSWNNLDSPNGRNRGDLLQTGHIEAERSQKFDVLYTRKFSNAGLFLRANVFVTRTENALAATTRLSTTGLSQQYRYFGLTNSENTETRSGATLSLIYEKKSFGLRAGYNFVWYPNADEPLPDMTALPDGTIIGPAEEGSRKFQQSAVVYGYLKPGESYFSRKGGLLGAIGKNLIAGLKLRFLKGYNSGINLIYDRQEEIDYFGVRSYRDYQAFIQLDAHLSKQFKYGKISVQPFLSIENLLNRENYFIGHRFTGKPDVTGLEDLNTNVPNFDLRRIDLVSFYAFPDNYARPRMIRLGISVTN